MGAEGGSEEHLRDITGILRVGGERVDTAYVRQWADKPGPAETRQGIGRPLVAQGKDGA